MFLQLRWRCFVWYLLVYLGFVMVDYVHRKQSSHRFRKTLCLGCYPRWSYHCMVTSLVNAYARLDAVLDSFVILIYLVVNVYNQSISALYIKYTIRLYTTVYYIKQKAQSLSELITFGEGSLRERGLFSNFSYIRLCTYFNKR